MNYSVGTIQLIRCNVEGFELKYMFCQDLKTDCSHQVRAFHASEITDHLTCKWHKGKGSART